MATHSPEAPHLLQIPRQENFHYLLAAQARNVLRAARALVTLLGDLRDIDKRVAEIRALEHKGDELTHAIKLKLSQTAIAPYDHKDIHALSSALDDTLDSVSAVATRFRTYKINETTAGARQLSRAIFHATDGVARAASRLHAGDEILRYCHQIRLLDKLADGIGNRCVAALFQDCRDAIDLIKWKDIYEVMEATMDKCKDVSNVLEVIVLKKPLAALFPAGQGWVKVPRQEEAEGKQEFDHET